MNHLQWSRQASFIGWLLLTAIALGWLAVRRSTCSIVDAGFWFESVSYSSDRLGGSITPQEIDTIASIARSELVQAFEGLGIAFHDRRDARFRVRVVQELHDMRFRRAFSIPAQSRAVTGFGGDGAVSFSWLASAAFAYAPDEAPRPTVLHAIGLGLGRAAVHEFTHEIIF